MPAPGAEGPEPRGSPRAKVAPLLRLHRENPAPPPPGLLAVRWSFPTVRGGGREEGEEPAARRPGCEPEALCLQTLSIACHHTGEGATAPVRGHSGRDGGWTEKAEPGQLTGRVPGKGPSCPHPPSSARPPARPPKASPVLLTVAGTEPGERQRWGDGVSPQASWSLAGAHGLNPARGKGET